MKILVVDDVALIRRTMLQFLHRLGHTAVTAESARSGLMMLQQDHGIQAVITDLHMPGGSGFDLFKAAQRIERINDAGPIPPPAFLLLTADRDDKVLRLAMDLGFAEVMRKPPDDRTLARALGGIEQSLAGEAVPHPRAAAAPVDLLAADVRASLATIGEAIAALEIVGDHAALEALHRELAAQLERISLPAAAAQTA